MSLTDEFKKDLERILGKECWGTIAGSGTGSVLKIQLGDRIPRRVTIKNPSLSKEQCEFDSQFSIFVECVWRLDSESEIICGAWDDNSADGTMVVGLRNLLGSTISSIDISQPALDLSVKFHNGLTFKVFCDSTNVGDADYNYTVSMPNVSYLVGTRSALIKQAS